jgi:hypothetical protein
MEYGVVEHLVDWHLLSRVSLSHLRPIQNALKEIAQTTLVLQHTSVFQAFNNLSRTRCEDTSGFVAKWIATEVNCRFYNHLLIY